MSPRPSRNAWVTAGRSSATMPNSSMILASIASSVRSNPLRAAFIM